MHGLALARSEVPTRLFEQHALAEREYARGGADGNRPVEAEVRFLWRASPPLLPVWQNGRMILARWGSRDRKGRLPVGGWTWEATVQAGGWANSGAEPADVPGTYVLAGGVWTRVRHGVRAMLVPTPAGPVAYVVCRPATRYYRVMTGVEWMPVLIGEVI